jgi:ribosomal-protein-alanine N-acetyltransferase
LQRPADSEIYSLNKLTVINGNKVRLRHKRLHDATNDYEWRRDDELCRLDAAQPLTNTFEEYLKFSSDMPVYSRRSCQFAIETLEGKYIGNCSYFDIDEDAGETEIGIMIGDKAYWSQGYGTDAMLTALNYIFSQTSLKRVYLKTLEWNIRAQKCFLKCGFAVCGKLIRDGYSFMVMEILRPFIAQSEENG